MRERQDRPETIPPQEHCLEEAAAPKAALVLRELRANAKEWWYHADLRRRGQHGEAQCREHESIRSCLRQIRSALENDGWLQIGRGGTTFHYHPNARAEGLHPRHVRACIAAGIPTMDTTQMNIRDVAELALRGPMAGFADDPFGTDPDGSLSTRQWRTIFNRYAARDGAVFHNYAPEPAPWNPAPPKASDNDDL